MNTRFPLFLAHGSLGDLARIVGGLLVVGTALAFIVGLLVVAFVSSGKKRTGKVEAEKKSEKVTGE